MQSFTPQWNILEELRENFLNERFSNKPYWKTPETLSQYDFTFAERIGWKWEAVLNEVKSKMLFDSSRPLKLIDWGCGTGIASRKFLKYFGADLFSELILWDQSSLAVSFAKEKIQSQFPQIKIQTAIPSSDFSPFILLVSHVLNELTNEKKNELMKLVSKAEIIIWVEPGTPKLSAQLIQIREELRSQFTVLAPCPHQNSCGLLSHAASFGWCHFFANPPSSVFQDAFWKTFSTKLGIDLRSLPTSFLVLSKHHSTNPESSRVLGRPRHYKGYTLALLCSSSGVKEEKLLKRAKSHLIEIMKENHFKTLIPPL